MYRFQPVPSSKVNRSTWQRDPQQRQANLALIQSFLLGLYIYLIDPTTAEIYGNLKAAVFDRYAPKDKAQRRKPKITQLGIGENDLWIAAVALQHKLTLLTTDRNSPRTDSQKLE
jgi:tRNA(fMet)-specific endonuclease VapC